MAEAKTQSVKYLFSDIVGFTRNRSVEAQSDLVAALNDVVLGSLQSLSLQEQDRILLPTGDGICVAIITTGAKYDIHVDLAFEILKLLAAHNESTPDEMRQFELRIGINENVDNLVTDVNGKTNVAGAGINMAQRIMSQADAGQVMIGQAVYETLHVREAYLKSFRQYMGTGKHGLQFPVFQFIADREGLNTEVPLLFRPKTPKANTLTKIVAFYIGFALKHKEFLLSRRDDPGLQYSATVWLYFQSVDLLEKSEASEYDSWRPNVYGAPKTTQEQQYKHYYDQDFWVKATLSEMIAARCLAPFSECFEGYEYTFASQRGEERLRKEWPDVAEMVLEYSGDSA